MNKKKILLVDDQVQISKQLKMILEMTEHYEVEEAHNGISALVLAKQYKPDIIFMDIVLPDMTGSDVVFQMKVDPELKAIPVVFLTGTVTEQEADGADNFMGGYPMLSKPVKVDRVIEMIKRFSPDSD